MPGAQVTRGVQEELMHCSITSPLHCHALLAQEEDEPEAEGEADEEDALVTMVVGVEP